MGEIASNDKDLHESETSRQPPPQTLILDSRISRGQPKMLVQNKQTAQSQLHVLASRIAL